MLHCLTFKSSDLGYNAVLVLKFGGEGMIHRLSISQLSVVVGGKQADSQAEVKGANNEPFWTQEKIILATKATTCLIFIATGLLYKAQKNKQD